MDNPDCPTAWICETCGTQYEPRLQPPARCAICEDERQYVGWHGQRWLSPAQLAAHHRIKFEEAAGVTTLHVEPSFAIGQRAFLIPHRDGLVMWECLSLVTDEAIAAIRKRGTVTAIAISHPHFYSAMADWSEALGGVAVWIHSADREWVRREAPVRYWDGASHDLAGNLTLIHLPGHFPGSAGLWWKDGPHPGGSLLPGDAIQVVADRAHTSFMYSYPNMIPLSPGTVTELRERVAALKFEDVFGFAPGRQIIGDAKAKVGASFDRYLRAVATKAGPDPAPRCP